MTDDYDDTYGEGPQEPRREVEPQDDRRGISHCWQNEGWHVYMAGPCFDTIEQARAYRDGLDKEGITWRPQL